MAALTDLQRAVVYGESELGEVAVLNPSAATYTILNARSAAVVLAAGQLLATVKARVAVIQPTVNRITS